MIFSGLVVNRRNRARTSANRVKSDEDGTYPLGRNVVVWGLGEVPRRWRVDACGKGLINERTSTNERGTHWSGSTPLLGRSGVVKGGADGEREGRKGVGWHFEEMAI